MKHFIHKFILLAIVLFPSMSTKAQEINDSVDIYANHVVSNQVIVQGRNILTSHDVTVTNTGDLKLSSPNGINITNNFTVNLGGVLELNGGMQYAIRYTYDATGNRTRRQRNNQ